MGLIPSWDREQALTLEGEVAARRPGVPPIRDQIKLDQMRESLDGTSYPIAAIGRPEAEVPASPDLGRGGGVALRFGSAGQRFRWAKSGVGCFSRWRDLLKFQKPSRAGEWPLAGRRADADRRQHR
jgi:hypothetical protein